MWVQRVQEGGRGQPCPKEPCPHPPLDRIPLHKFTSIRRTMSEVGGPVENLIAKGSISKYAQGVPAVTGGPVPEVLKNYMDVSVGVGCPLGRGVAGLTQNTALGKGPWEPHAWWRDALAFSTSLGGLTCPVWEELPLGHAPCLMAAGSHLWGLHSPLSCLAEREGWGDLGTGDVDL